MEEKPKTTTPIEQPATPHPWQPNRKERRAYEAIIRKRSNRARKQAAKLTLKGTP